MRRRLIVTACLVFTLLLVGATVYKKWPPLFHKPSNNRNAISSSSLSSIPPFATKEPERYQAKRTITFTESASTASSPLNEARSTNVLIVRDGEQRREEYEAGGLGTIAYLENSAGRFVLLPQAKLYAKLDSNDSEVGLNGLRNETDIVSPDLPLNESPVASRYQKLGAETIDGRATTKYQVTNSGQTHTTVSSKTFIWIDEALGMPIKSESTHVDSDRSTKVLMELQDIRSDVDSKLFVLPADYRKVAVSLIVGKIRQATSERQPAREQSPALPK